MLRLALITALATALNLSWAATTYADGFDSLINLELAFRDKILDQPAPNCYQALIRDGETTISFVRDFPDSIGKTDFFLNSDWSYNYRYTNRATETGTEVSVTALNIKIAPRLRHLIRLPLAWYQAEVWESRLLSHEFDHVAVSLDPRPRALLVHLCSKLPTHRFSIGAEEKPSDKQLRQRIDREIQRRVSAVLDLVRANYVLLDKVSRNGQVAMRDRNAFFKRLYTRSNLEATEFPFRQEVAPLLESERYRQLRPRHVPVDPTARPLR